MPIARLVAFLALLPFAVALPAQQVTGGAAPDRKATNVAIADAESRVLAAVAIAYGAPAWRDSYDDMLDHMNESNYTRLGTGWWTTFDTIGTLEIGGTKVAAGSYYLGLRVDAKGAMSLLLFDSARAMQGRLLPGATPLYTGAAKPDIVAPLTFARGARKEVAPKLEIEITVDAKTPTKGVLAIRWGKHEATAPVVFELGGKPAGAK